jgi:hypothetical protein
MKVSIFVGIDAFGLVCIPIFVVVYKTKKIMINMLLNNKNFVDVMKKCNVHSTYNIRMNIYNMLGGICLYYNDNMLTYTLKCITRDMEYGTLFYNRSKVLHCIFKVNSVTGGYINNVYTPDYVDFRLVRLNGKKEYDTQYDKYGWLHYLEKREVDYVMSQRIDIGNGGYRYTKKVLDDELIICRNKQRDIDFMERLSYMLEEM